MKAQCKKIATLFRTHNISNYLLALSLLAALPMSAQDNLPPLVSSTTGFAVSAPLRDLAILPSAAAYGFSTPEPVRKVRRLPSGPVVDIVEQSWAPATPNFSVGLNFLGVGDGFPGYTVTGPRPETNIGVGDTQIVEWAFSSYAVFDKSTGATLAGPIDRSTLFQSLGGVCSTNNSLGNIAQWDKLAHRWVLAGNTGAEPYTTCVAVSTSADATGTYYLYQYPQGDPPPNFITWGIWGNAYYKSQEEGDNVTDVGARLCAYNRAKMLVGDASAEEICFQMSQQDEGIQPADVDSNVAPPSGQDELFATIWDNSHFSVYSLHPDFANPANSFVTGNQGSQLIAVPAFTPGCNGQYYGFCVPQKDTHNLLEFRGGGFGYRIAYWDDTPPSGVRASPPIPLPRQHWYITSDVLASNGSDEPRWYEFTAPQRSTPVTGITLFQAGTYAPDSNYRWNSSISRDKTYNILLGYNVSNTDMYPSIRITGRILRDPLGTMEDEVTVVDGMGSYTANPAHWGGNSAMKIGPDGCTFYFASEYLLRNSPRFWSTRIASAKFANCE